MNIGTQLLFFLSAIGVFNGTLLSLYFLFFKRGKRIADHFLGALLLAISIRVGKSVFFYFNPDLSKSFLQIGLSACFFIGPLLFFYITSMLLKLSNKVVIPVLFLLLLFVIAFGILVPYRDHVSLWGGIIYYIINAQWLIFILLSYYASFSIFRKVTQPNTSLTYDEVWIVTVIAGVSILWLSYSLAHYTSYISGALSFSFIFYLSYLVLFYKKNRTFEPVVRREKYSTKIDADLAQEISAKIADAFEVRKVYTNPDLTLPVLSRELNVRHQLLSQYINDNLNKSFTLFINEYRIEEAKRLLKEQKNLKIDAVGIECGFNSSSSFYSTFKKITGTTPNSYSRS